MNPAAHDWFDWSPIGARASGAWPGGARLAVAFVVAVEYYEMQPPAQAAWPASLPGGFGRGPYPDFRTWSHREYGNRIGVFRVMDALDRHGMRATAAVDAYCARERSVVVDECRRRNWEIAAHGEAVTRLLSSRLGEEDERSQIRAALQAVREAAGGDVAGWLGPEQGESARTPALLAEAGIRYVLDWPNDERPYPMRTPGGPLVSLPMAIDLDDVFAHWHRKLSMARWRQSIADAAERLLADGESRPRALVLCLHPWLVGQPWRISYLEEVLADLRRREGVWFATAGEIAARCGAGDQRSAG